MSQSMIHWLRTHIASCTLLTLTRVYIGFLFIMAAIPKVFNPLWTGSDAGAALTKFVEKSLLLSQGTHPEVTSWFAAFLRNVVLPYAPLFSYLVAWGELFTGIALVLGFFTNFSVLMGIMMNTSYLLAGTSSINVGMLFGEFLILFAGHNAAKIGLDHWLTNWYKKYKPKRKKQ